MILKNASVCVVTKTFNTSLMKLSRNEFLIYTNFLTTAIINVFYCCEKVFILMNILMIDKNSMKHHYLKKEAFCSHLYMEDNTDTQKELGNILK